MSNRTRVVWSEGLLLTPQHLQEHDRYLEERSIELYRAGQPFAHGCLRLTLQEDAIQNGQVLLEDAAGVLPGGTAFSIPDRDPVPAGRNIEPHFGLRETVLPIYLGLRVHRTGQAEVAAPGTAAASDARWLKDAVRVPDAATGQNEREVQVGRANLRVLFPGENLGDYEVLKIAEAVRKPEGGFAYRTEYVPPSLAISASPYILRIVRKLLEILVAKSTELSDRRRQTGKGIAEFGRDDVAGFWLLGTVNGAIPVLTHFLRGGGAHPEAVYLALAQFAGQVTTMSDLQVRDIAPYDHEHLEAAYTDLLNRIPKLLETVLPRNYTRIPLTRRDDGVWSGRIADDRLLDAGSHWFLGAYANVAASELQSLLPDMIKVASPDRVDFLVAHSLMGLRIRYTQNLPPALPIQAGYTYFIVEKTGDVWDLVHGARQIALYAPPEFPGMLLELISVRE